MKLCDLLVDVQLGYLVKEYIALLKEISDRELISTAQKLEIKHSISSMKKKANIDSLTGVYNRSFLESTVNEWLKQASNHKENIVCIVFDIDNFKSFNDQFGHLFGDEVIKQVSKACLDVLGEGEIIGRFGGDEFIVMVKDASLEFGKSKARQITDLISNINMKKDKTVVSITVSIGVADNSVGTITSFQELFHQADLALYQAKNAGKNQIYIRNNTLTF